MKKKILFLNFFVIFFTFCSTKDGSKELISSSGSNIEDLEVKNNFNGYWTQNCEEGSGSIRISDSVNVIEVNSNQIYIDATISKKIGNERKLFLEKPSDLGKGGINLPWNDFSKTKPIGKIILENDTTLKVEWYGFFNNKTNNYMWISEPDWLHDKEDNNIRFKNCE